MATRDNQAQSFGSRLVQVGFLIAVLVLWYLATTRWGVNRLLLPNPVAVWQQLLDVLRSGEYLPDLRVTLTELVIAFALAMTSGTIVGFFVSRRRYTIRVFDPLFAAIYSIPIIMFLPLYVLFFGLGPASKIALGATISFFPIVLSTIAGFGNVDRTLVTAARSMGASDFHLFRYVLVPGALPVILSGLRMGFTIALLSIIGSETIASLAGLGHHIVQLAEGMDMARMFAYIAFVVVIAALLNGLVSFLEARGRRWA
ncbi:MAG: ABC transporter permease [Xanthobacteraceae bacterium]|jgi:ABC-type nitrate/sulfonate/bicarbonate transport system permease component